MTTYTGVADANGDFTIPFSSNYTSGQKITVTAEKDSAVKTIELHAPSDTTGGGVIQFTGNLTNFPFNIGNIVLTQLSGAIANSAFDSATNFNLFGKATGLDMSATTVTIIGRATFQNWRAATSLILPQTLTYIDAYGFVSWSALFELVIPDSCLGVGESACSGMTALTKLTIGTSFSNANDNAFSDMSSLTEMILRGTTPPTIQASTLAGLNGSCIIKVPLASLSAYQTASNWSAHASKMVGV